MVLRKNIKISREEAIHYLFNESSTIGGLIASSISSGIAFLASYYVLVYAKFIRYNLIEMAVITGIYFLAGIGLYYIKKQEFMLYDKTHSAVFIHGLLTYPMLVLIYASMFVYFLVPQWNIMAGEGTNLLSSIITALLVALIFSFLFNALWQFTDMMIMQVFAKRDWVVVAERDYFIGGLGMRFEEARRYGTSLSLVHLRIGINPRRKKRLLKVIYRRVAEALREIDSISHFEDWNSIIILAPITEAAAKGLLTRISKIMKEELYKNGIRDNVEVSADISTLNRETENEFDLLKPQENVTQTLSFENIPK